MMSATPIFEQLCREIFDAGKAWSADNAQPVIARQSQGPAHSLEETGDGLAYERDSYVPRVLAGWASPTG
jgi:hypothetical protein